MKSQISVCLVRTKYSRNLGYVARAMSNLGVEKLILIDTKCEINLKAFEGAAGGNQPLRKHESFENWDAFNKKYTKGVRLALSRRGGRYRAVTDLSEEVLKLGTNDLFLFFGPEDHGLSNEDLEHVHATVELPAYGEFKSFSLSHAAVLTLYLVQKSLQQELATPQKISPAATVPLTLISDWLKSLGFKNLDSKKSAAVRLLGILQRSRMNADEVKLLEKVIFQSRRKIERSS